MVNETYRVSDLFVARCEQVDREAIRIGARYELEGYTRYALLTKRGGHIAKDTRMVSILGKTKNINHYDTTKRPGGISRNATA